MELSEKEFSEILQAQKDLLESLKEENASLKQNLEKSNKESADRRHRLNEMEAGIAEVESLKKRAYAAERILEKANIRPDWTEIDLSGLEIKDGEVSGEVGYSIPKPSAELSNPSGGADSVLSLDKIASMKPEEINKSWDEILELDRAGALR